MLLHIGLTFLVAALFGFVCLKLKIPGGMLVGAILGVASLNIFTGMAVMPYPAKFTAQATAGAFIGFQVKRDDLSRMKALLRPALLMLTCMMLTNLVVGFGIYAVGTMDLVTAMMCAVPGGMGDTPLIAADMGANAGQVVVMQFVRMCFGIGVFPSLIVALNRRLHAGMPAETCAAVCLDDEDKPGPPPGRVGAGRPPSIPARQPFRAACSAAGRASRRAF
jgi:membrane AbrB-like protein